MKVTRHQSGDWQICIERLEISRLYMHNFVVLFDCAVDEPGRATTRAGLCAANQSCSPPCMANLTLPERLSNAVLKDLPARFVLCAAKAAHRSWILDDHFAHRLPAFEMSMGGPRLIERKL